MHWIALLPSADEVTAWGWWALQFTPRVARSGEALLLEMAASERLFGGRRALLRRLLRPPEPLSPAPVAQGPTSLVALALLRLELRGQPAPGRLPDDLPLDVLDAAAAEVSTVPGMQGRSHALDRIAVPG